MNRGNFKESCVRERLALFGRLYVQGVFPPLRQGRNLLAQAREVGITPANNFAAGMLDRLVSSQQDRP